MNQAMDCSQARICLGVYVLGAIDPTERAMVDAHLATCRDCRDELAGLAGLPALLARVSSDDVLSLDRADAEPVGAGPAEDPHEKLLGKVLDLAAARRRRRALRATLATAAAALVIAAGAFAGAHVLTTGNSPPVAGVIDPHPVGQPQNSWETVKGSNSAGQGVWVSYRSMGWGLELDAKVVGIPLGATCQLYVITHDGQRHMVSQWWADNGENNTWYHGSAAIAEPDVASFVVTTGGRTPPIAVPLH